MGIYRPDPVLCRRFYRNHAKNFLHLHNCQKVTKQNPIQSKNVWYFIRCELQHAVYNLIVQYLVFGIIVAFGWAIAGWIISNPLRNPEYFIDWLFIHQLAEILPYDLYQICWAAIAYIRRKSVTDGVEMQTKSTDFWFKLKVSYPLPRRTRL